jgi:hypothetical protein
MERCTFCGQRISKRLLRDSIGAVCRGGSSPAEIVAETYACWVQTYPTRSTTHVDSPRPLSTLIQPGKRAVSSGIWLMMPTI